MPLIERRYGVWLHADRVGTLNQRGDYTWFTFSDDYLGNAERAVLGLAFEEDLHARHSSALRLPPWFSNLLPEGPLRNWIAHDRAVSPDREMELLAQVGRDLPGAVQVLVEDQPPEFLDELRIGDSSPALSVPEKAAAGWRFSLAGVALKFSMLKKGDRLVLPAFGQGGDWIVKLPDPLYVDVPRNEHTMMSLAAAAGIEVPEHVLVPREKLDSLPDEAWRGTETLAYAVKRFDRGERRALVHIEDLAQVRNRYAEAKYEGNLETVAALVYRRRDEAALREFARRVAFNVLVSNGDAHLKNWSLIYSHPRIPTLSPVYDLVATGYYKIDDEPEDLGLKFGGTRRFDQVNLGFFKRLQDRLGASAADLPGCVVETVDRVASAWPKVAELLEGNQHLQDFVGVSIDARRRSLLGL
ncbi:MAG TPA: type II toxin-antitoxin system HipA family toxin [Actinophytocola sp.]|uniref:type II toxin-antitoxin system HipA family toxin n=1 Tax=Actinophytocola sp. TaxID=1872138 RepID=UPI002DBB9F69|nr:type II toxin-antitoxin system HipA family toxin [Actinophytocola sp.]HEU5472034.1 type II toxin-antitoxin system HipA family toxin [Actinophytocola sp.]